mmetsp:Transcript_30743/g.76907  ORF Transcript_30743/g.76907 Transcript_30743/m.76907 type:complete len:257 (+) Transcript_30743:1282-2052(+)
MNSNDWVLVRSWARTCCALTCTDFSSTRGCTLRRSSSPNRLPMMTGGSKGSRRRWRRKPLAASRQFARRRHWHPRSTPSWLRSSPSLFLTAQRKRLRRERVLLLCCQTVASGGCLPIPTLRSIRTPQSINCCTVGRKTSMATRRAGRPRWLSAWVLNRTRTRTMRRRRMAGWRRRRMTGTISNPRRKRRRRSKSPARLLSDSWLAWRAVSRVRTLGSVRAWLCSPRAPARASRSSYRRSRRMASCASVAQRVGLPR